MKRLLPTALICATLMLGSSAWSADPHDQTCLECHDRNIVGALGGSVHQGLSCVDCHNAGLDFKNVPHATKPVTPGCASCHQEEAKEYSSSDTHAKARARGGVAPYCNDCHGGHNVTRVNESAAPTAKLNQPRLCGRCHSDERLNMAAGIAKRNLVSRYEFGVHWQALRRGRDAAACTDCHGAHNILSSEHEASTIARHNIAKTCRGCHSIESQHFLQGAHGKALMHGNHDVPSCITCHGDHDMASLRERSGIDARLWAATQVCIWCHGNERMMKRYALDTAPVDSYMRDYHGLTQRGAGGRSATCADCHDAHYSLPSSHPMSRMNISNRGAACGKCHGQVSQNFIMSFSHHNPRLIKEPSVPRIVRTVYIWLIFIVLVGMLAHNFIIWRWAIRRKWGRYREEPTIRRMTWFELAAHLAIAATFTLLAISGFMLLLPEAFWVRWLLSVGINENVRAWSHRASAVVMITCSISMALYYLANSRGRLVLRSFIPRLREDWRELWGTMLFYLGRRPRRPQSGLFGYAEKAEFWALVWGTSIMAITGLVLWFPKMVPSSWPPWVIELMRTIHLFEAILAVMAIIVWHLFQTIFHPEEYPMALSWLNGRLTQAEADRRFNERAQEIMRLTTPRPPEGQQTD